MVARYRLIVVYSLLLHVIYGEERMPDEREAQPLQPGREFQIFKTQADSAIRASEQLGAVRGLCANGEMEYKHEWFPTGVQVDFKTAEVKRYFSTVQMRESRVVPSDVSLKRHRRGSGIAFEYPPIQEGQLVPLFGAVCQIVKVTHDSHYSERKQRWHRSANMQLRILTDKELPPGIRHPMRLHALPFGSTIPAASASPYFRLVKTIPLETSYDLPLVVGEYQFPHRKGRQSVTLTVGDEIYVPNHDPQREKLTPSPRYIIQDIVQPDPEKNVIGWILVEPDFFALAPADALLPENIR